MKKDIWWKNSKKQHQLKKVTICQWNDYKLLVLHLMILYKKKYTKLYFLNSRQRKKVFFSQKIFFGFKCEIKSEIRHHYSIMYSIKNRYLFCDLPKVTFNNVIRVLVFKNINFKWALNVKDNLQVKIGKWAWTIKYPIWS